MRWIVYLYPAAWRRRYGDEFGALLQDERISLRLLLDVVGGAIDAQTHRRDYGRLAEKAPSIGGTAVLTRRNPIVGMLLISLAVVAVMIVMVLAKRLIRAIAPGLGLDPTVAEALVGSLDILSVAVSVAFLPWYATRLGYTCELPQPAAIRSWLRDRFS